MINKIPQFINAIVNHWMFIGALVLSHTTSMSVWIPVCLFAFTVRALILENIRLKQYSDWVDTNESELSARKMQVVETIVKSIQPELDAMRDEFNTFCDSHTVVKKSDI